MNSKILLSSVIHKRFGKIDHLFKYKVPSIFLDLYELEKVKDIILDTEINMKIKMNTHNQIILKNLLVRIFNIANSTS